MRPITGTTTRAKARISTVIRLSDETLASALAYTATWDIAEEQRYRLTAVATNDAGWQTTSRIVVVQVGELYGDFEAFTNTTAEFERLGANEWAITANGANMWQSVDEYGSLYLPAVDSTLWEATVKIESQQNTHNSAKAGLIVRNDVTQPGQSRGYAAMTMRAGLPFEWLRDTGSPSGGLDASTSAGANTHPAWVRIRRDGDEYTGYWSTDGENFTPVGTDVLPGAAEVQDIGLVVTAHNANATSRAVFSDFVLDLDPDDPDPGPDPQQPGPVCLMQQSDEFDDETLNAKRWTTVRTADSADVQVVDGSLVLPVTEGDINEAGSGPISFVGQPASDGEWEVTTKVTIEHTREWQHAGLMLHADDDNYVKLAFTRNAQGGRFLEFQTETDGSRTWHDSTGVPDDFPATIHLRLVSDGDELTAAYSTDGEAWTELSGAGPVKADASIGMVAAGDPGPA
jgi:regulation of enolase protein 1 (concanavalin A-like superfamily)